MAILLNLVKKKKNRMYFETIRQSAPLTFPAMFSGTFAVTLYGRISICWQFSDIVFVVF